MADLSTLLDQQRGLPSGSGLNGRVLQAPAVGQPALSQDVAGAAGQALEQAGQSAIGAADLRLRSQELDARLARADATLFAKTKLQDFVQVNDSDYDELSRDPDYSTFAQRVLDKGKERITEMAREMPPAAAKLFQEDALQRLSLTHQHALTQASQRRMQTLAYSMTTAKDQARVDFENATTPADQAEAMARYEQFNTDLVNAGLLHGDKAAADTKEMQQLGSEILATRWVKAYPDKALEHFQARLKGEAGRDDAPEVPRGKETAYRDLAQQEMQKLLTEKRQTEAAAEKDVAKGQEMVERELTTQIWQAPNVNALLGLRRVVDRLSQDTGADGLSDDGQRRTYAAIEARITKFEQPGPEPRSNQATLRDVTSTVWSGQGTRTPEQAVTIQNNIIAAMNAGKLTATDARMALGELAQQGRQDSPLRSPGVAQSRSLLQDSIKLTGPLATILPEARNSEIEALRAYDYQIRQTAETQGIDAAERLAPVLQQELSQVFATQTTQAMMQKLQVMPPEVSGGILNEDGFPGSSTLLNTRFAEAKRELTQRLATGQMTKDDAALQMYKLDARQQAWKYVLQHQGGKQGTPTPTPTPSTLPQTQPAQPGLLQRFLKPKQTEPGIPQNK